jgi:tetratricopeptide (TPR) repeat protein
MRAESIAFALSGILFGVIVGWILGSQQSAGPAPAAATAPGTAATAAGDRAPAPPLDEARLKTLIAAAGSELTNPAPRVQLGNLYFDAERYTDAVQWYEDALRLQPKDANVSTDLGVAYYYTNEPDKAIAQFEKSLAIDPAHTKTMLNMGIVKPIFFHILHAYVSACSSFRMLTEYWRRVPHYVVVREVMQIRFKILTQPCWSPP